MRSTGQKSQSVNIGLRPSLCFTQLNSRIPLVRTSSESVVRRLGTIGARREAVLETIQELKRKLLDPTLRANPFPRSYGSILPTSLTYILLSTRGCSPWRPDAVMSTSGCDLYRGLPNFSRAVECTGHHRRVMLYQQLGPISG
ncbi:unnamed protein product [Bathycoccus prasinos]